MTFLEAASTFLSHGCHSIRSGFKPLGSFLREHMVFLALKTSFKLCTQLLQWVWPSWQPLQAPLLPKRIVITLTTPFSFTVHTDRSLSRGWCQTKCVSLEGAPKLFAGFAAMKAFPGQDVFLNFTAPRISLPLVFGILWYVVQRRCFPKFYPKNFLLCQFG